MRQVNVPHLSQCSLQNAELSRNARELPRQISQPVVESYPPLVAAEVAESGPVEGVGPAAPPEVAAPGPAGFATAPAVAGAAPAGGAIATAGVPLAAVVWPCVA